MRGPFVLTALALGAAAALAAPPDAKLPPPQRVAQADTADAARWATLSPQERAVLAPLQDGWDRMDGDSRLKWQEIARRFPDMPAARQERVRARMHSWAQMTPDERVQARQTFTRTKGLSREERRAQWEAYQALSPEEREALVNQPARSNPAGRSGASTRPVGVPGAQPTHQQSGGPPINVMPGMVDRTTLLPLRGPQGAAQVQPSRPPPQTGKPGGGNQKK